MFDAREGQQGPTGKRGRKWSGSKPDAFTRQVAVTGASPPCGWGCFPPLLLSAGNVPSPSQFGWCCTSPSSFGLVLLSPPRPLGWCGSLPSLPPSIHPSILWGGLREQNLPSLLSHMTSVQRTNPVQQHTLHHAKQREWKSSTTQRKEGGAAAPQKWRGEQQHLPSGEGHGNTTKEMGRKQHTDPS